MGDPMRFLATAADTGGRSALAEQRVRPEWCSAAHSSPGGREHLRSGGRVRGHGERRGASRRAWGLCASGGALFARSLTRNSSEGRLLIQHTPGAASEFYIGMGRCRSRRT